MNKDLLVFEELAKKSLIPFENTDRFKITLGLTMMYMGFIRASKEVKDARFAQFIGSSKYPPNRHMLAITIINNLAGRAVTDDMLHESVEGIVDIFHWTESERSLHWRFVMTFLSNKEASKTHTQIKSIKDNRVTFTQLNTSMNGWIF